MKNARLDYHEGLSFNQVKIILQELGLDQREFNKWMNGQTCPCIERRDEAGNMGTIIGVYEYDLFRWIRNQKTGELLIWD